MRCHLLVLGMFLAGCVAPLPDEPTDQLGKTAEILDVAPQGVARVVGVLLDHEGNPVHGAEIRLPASDANATTVHGGFNLWPALPGWNILIVLADGHAPLQVGFRAVESERSTVRIQLPDPTASDVHVTTRMLRGFAEAVPGFCLPPSCAQRQWDVTLDRDVDAMVIEAFTKGPAGLDQRPPALSISLNGDHWTHSERLEDGGALVLPRKTWMGLPQGVRLSAYPDGPVVATNVEFHVVVSLFSGGVPPEGWSAVT